MANAAQYSFQLSTLTNEMRAHSNEITSIFTPFDVIFGLSLVALMG